MSKPEWFKYETIWRKAKSTGHLNCKVMPLRQHENLLIFGRGRVTYNPQLEIKPERNQRPLRKYKASECYGRYSEDAHRTIPLNMSYPRSVLDFPNTNQGEAGLHPTQKPLALLEYLVKTYTNPGEIVVDNCFGSGTTGVACVHTGRRFIGIEIEPCYFEIAKERIATALTQRC